MALAEALSHFKVKLKSDIIHIPKSFSVKTMSLRTIIIHSVLIR